ncbi:hypothetical protein VitviT2T_007380 [Vitis vinifera]|uniref:PGG domain-containing protein n=1 Tax=Vitis vinifera TaxID=29760 RepID=A0ABY9BYM7_VITVI|nr:hypothetical protein VitviT2T_007380 [Vitis vinifera]
MIAKLLEWKPDLTKEVDENGWSPLHCAAYLGYTKIAEQLLDKSSDKSITYLAIKDTKKTALHFAANRHHRETVKLLLSHSPDCCEQVDDQGNNFLHFAAMSKRPFAIDDLFPNDNKLRVRGLVNEKDAKGDTPLHLLSSCQCYNPVFSMDNAVDKMALNDDKLTALDILSRANIKSGQMFGGKLKKQMKEWEKVVVGPFSWQEAVNKDNGSSSKNKDVREDESMAFTERLGETHLIVATLVATVSCAAGFTLPGGYNDSDGMAKLRKQVAFKSFIVTDTLAVMLSVSAVFVYFVMSLHKDKDILAKQLVLGTCLTMSSMDVLIDLFAMGFNSLTVVENLIEAAKQLHGDTERGDSTVCVAMLRMTNEDNDTALHEAVRYHHPKVVKLLIQEDPEFIYGANNEGNTPLYMAADWGFRDLVQMIQEICSSPAHSGFKGRMALHAAVILNEQVMTKKTLEWKRALTNELDENRWSPLHFAAYVGCHPTIVRQLLEQFDRDVVYPRRQRPWKQDNSSYCSEPRPCGHSEAAGVALSRLLRES